MPALSGLQ